MDRGRMRADRGFARTGCAALFFALAGCSGGGSGETLVPGPDPPASLQQASRFLTRASFGPTEQEVQRLAVIGYTAWFDEQKAYPVSLERPTLSSMAASNQDVYQNQRLDQWWKIALTKKDQLRQRMAFALSEILVVSDVASALAGDPIGMAEYYDTLARGALGNYRTLLEDVTKSPVMGRYLSMLKNQKADPANNIRPDENYAREVLQLFSIGLVKLNADGTPQLDGSNQPIPTYDQSVVEGFAQVFTGWNYAGADSWEWPDENWQPMEAWEGYHETAAKTLLDGVVSPASQTAQADLSFALDLVFAHPNVGPFVARQLIQRLVTSNPSPEYVARAAAVFADDGTGVRGDLFAVAKAILTDVEAVNGPSDHPDSFGKLREPLLAQTALWRAFHASPPGGLLRYWYPEDDFGQAPLRAGSVFNFFRPDFVPPGDAQQAGLAGPEFQIATEQRVTTGTNRFWECVFEGYAGVSNPQPDIDLLHLDAEIALATDPAALVERLNQLLMSGQMSQEMRDIVVSMVEDTDGTTSTGRRQRVLEALYLIVTSPEFSVQK